VVAGEDIAFGSYRHLKVHIVIDQVGFVEAHIVGHAGGPEVWSGEAISDGVFFGDDAHAFDPAEEDWIFIEEAAPVFELFVEAGDEAFDHADRFVGDVVLHAADPGMAYGEAHASQLVKDAIDFLSFPEGPEEHGDGAGIHDHCSQPQEVGGDTGEFGGDGADVLGSGWGLDLEELFYGEAPGDVIGVGGEVIHAVGVGHELLGGFVFGDFLDAPVEIADVYDGFDDFFAI